MIRNFIMNNKALIALLLLSSAIALLGIFVKITSMAIVGVILTLFTGLYRAYSAYATRCAQDKKIDEQAKKIEELEERTSWGEF